jgi:hypothetical protein
VFYIIESQDQLQWIENLMDSPVFIDVVGTNDYFHPILNSTIGVYIRPLQDSQGYFIPISHDDGLNVDKQRVYNILLKAQTLYTLNKKTLLYHFNLQRAIDVSLVYSMNNFKKLEYSTSNCTVDWYYLKYSDKKDINRMIPLVKLYERCEDIYNSLANFIADIKIPNGFEFYNTTATNVFYLLEQNGVGIVYDGFTNMFKPKNPLYNIVDNVAYTDYNLYNSTSRPTNAFNSINFAAIPKTAEHRKCFKPQNNLFVEFDFDGYHLRLLAQQINYELTQESAHKQLAYRYFGKEEITEEEYNKAKQINFQAIYGRIPEEHKNLEIFILIQDYINQMWRMFKKDGFVCNPQSGKPFTVELPDMNPAKLMNYMMQSLETSNNISILKDILRYLKDKKSFIALYTYDSIIVDLSLEDGKQVPNSILKIMEREGKFPVKFKYNTNLML